MEKPNITMAGFFNAATPKIERSAEYRAVYSNAVRSGVSPWDIRLVFGEVAETADHSQAVQDQITVIMSPEQAKAALRVFENSIKGYESLFGEIKDLTPILEKAKAAIEPK